LTSASGGKNETETPVPLGCIAVRRDVEEPERVEGALRRSVEHARSTEDDDRRAYVREHAQEMDDDVLRRHIDLYVNGYTVDMGEEGVAAVRELFERGRSAGVLPETDASLLP